MDRTTWVILQNQVTTLEKAVNGLKKSVGVLLAKKAPKVVLHPIKKAK